MDKFQYFLEYLANEPIIIQLIWVVSFVLFIAIIVLIIYLKVLRTYLRDKGRIVEKYSKKYELLLITYLYAEEDEFGVNKEQNLIIKRLKKGILFKFKRQVIISTLLKLRNEISGELADSIQNLYNKTKLKKYALLKLNNRQWDIIVTGIRELRLFNIKEAHDDVIKHINHPKKEVRKEVQLYLINLFHFEGLRFLNDLKTPLSEWDQIQLLEELQKIDNQELVDVSDWLKSDNFYVVIFAIKLVKIYNKFEMKEPILNLLNHPNENVRIELFPVLSHLHIIESKEVLKDKFYELSQEEQFLFFKLLEELADKDDESFIEQQLNHSNFEIRLLALKLLKYLNETKFNQLETSSNDAEFETLVKYVKNS